MEIQNIFSKKVTTPVSTIRTESSYDFDATQSLLEMMMIFEEEAYQINEEHLQAMHIGLKDNNVEILTEGLGSAMLAIIKFFKNLIDKFSKFIKNVLMVIRAYIGDFDKFINNYKDELKKLDPDFTIQGFEYTFKENVPNLTRATAIISSFDSDLHDIKRKTKAEINEERQEFANHANLARIRAGIIGRSGEIAAEDFHTEIKKVFRDGQETEQEIKVDKAYLHKVIDEYSKIKQMLGKVSRERDNIISLLSSAKAFFEKGASIYYKDNTKMIKSYHISVNDKGDGIKHTDSYDQKYDAVMIEKLNVFYNFKYLEAKEVGTMCVSAMTEKVNAIKENLKLYRAIVRKSIFGNKSGEDKKEDK